MTDAISRIRAALAAYNTLHKTDGDAWTAASVEFTEACDNPAAMDEVLQHIDAQQAEIAALRVDAEGKVSVDKAALREVLQALLGPPHYIRELQMLTGNSAERLTGDTAITKLVKQYNAVMKE